jgi:shikimate kinase
MPRVIVLVGMMGSGKTTVGKRVAVQLGMPFVDTDDLVEARAGKPVRDIFAQDGEAAFRVAESAVLTDVLSTEGDLVIAAAGGTVLSDDNRSLMKHKAQAVVWLDADVATLGDRTGRSSHRPLLDGDATARLATLSEARRHLYESVATVRIDTAGKPINEVVQLVVGSLTTRHGT